MTKNRMSLGFVVLFAAACPGLADLLYTTGEPTPIIEIATGLPNNGGYISGFFSASQPGRYTATGFTLADPVDVDEVVVYWFDNASNPTLPAYTTLEWVFYADDVGGGPGTVVASGTLDKTAITDEEWFEPVNGVSTLWKHRFALDTTLDAGTYWLSFHGIEGSIAWLTGALDGWDDLYRANVGTDYTLYTNTIWETPDDPDRIYHVAFDLLGTVVSTPPCDGDANGDNVVDPLDAGYVLARLGCSVGTGDPDCDAADVNLDGVVDPLDAGYVLARFGDCEDGLHGGNTPPTSDREVFELNRPANDIVPTTATE